MAAFNFALYYNLNKAFWTDFVGFFSKNQPYPQLFSEHFAGCLVFFGYSYIRKRTLWPAARLFTANI